MTLRASRIAKLETASLGETIVHVIQAQGSDEAACDNAREAYSAGHTVKKNDLVVTIRRFSPIPETAAIGGMVQ
jgi:hypothetical protein